jgi:hypothetical protein
MRGHATVPVLCTAGLSGWVDSAVSRLVHGDGRNNVKSAR